MLNGRQEGLIAAGAVLDECGSFNSDYVNFANRLFLMGEVSRVDTFESCSECMQVACDEAAPCAEGQVCEAGVCVPEPVDPGVAPNGCPGDCTGCFDGNACRATNEWWTCGDAETVCGYAESRSMST